MSKKPPSSDKDEAPADDSGEAAGENREEATEVLATDPDPVQIGRAADDESIVNGDSAPAQLPADQQESAPQKDDGSDAVQPPPPRRGLPWFGILNFLLILALAAGAGYYWRERQQLDAVNQSDIAQLRAQLDTKAASNELKSIQSNLGSSLSPLESKLGDLGSKVDELGLGQKDLRKSTEKLYQLYGRDKNDWQLAEVEYLMRVAQHKLILQDDFEGAAITLQAASDLVGLTGDPGLLPVRVKISEEIAELKTRRRPDLVGITLRLSQLGRQLRGLQPGFALRVDDAPAESTVPAAVDESGATKNWMARFNAFLKSLVSIRKESTDPTEIEANIVDVAQLLEDNLKLARWAVLDRNAHQYETLLAASLKLFREFYDLDNAANADFMNQLQELQKMVINPEKPDITGSLREMKRILSQRENAPQPAAAPAPEAAPESGDG